MPWFILVVLGRSACLVLLLAFARRSTNHIKFPFANQFLACGIHYMLFRNVPSMAMNFPTSSSDLGVYTASDLSFAVRLTMASAEILWTTLWSLVYNGHFFGYYKIYVAALAIMVDLTRYE
jgi:hypothetical protein